MSPKKLITSSIGNDLVLTAACCSAIATFVPVALYQTGMLSSLPDPPAPIFNSEQITSSKAAHPLGVPDTLLGIASFGATLTLILLAKRSPAARKLLGAKLAIDASAGAFNAGRQVVSFGKLCSWCTGTAISAGVTAYAGRNVIRESWSDAVLSVRSAYEERA